MSIPQRISLQEMVDPGHESVDGRSTISEVAPQEIFDVGRRVEIEMITE